MRALRLAGRDGGARGPLAAGLLALLCAAYLWEIVSVAGVPVARDMQMFFVPQKFLLWDALQNGRLPLWTPHIGTGAPLMANFQSGVFYPPHWAFAVLPFLPAFNLLVAFHFILGGLFAFALARRLGLDVAPAFVAAASFALGGYFASLLNLINALQGAAWAPGLAWALVRHLDRRSAGSLATLAAVGALALLAGEPQSFLFAGFAAAVVASLHAARHEEARRRPAALLIGLAASALLVIGLAMVQLLPTAELVRESARAAEGLSYGEAAAFDLDPIRLVHLFVPPDYRDPEYAFGVRSVIGSGDPWLFSIYLGALWPILFYFAWRNPRRRAETITWSAIAAAGVLVALGDHTPVFPWLFEHVPGFSSFRFPEKYLFVTAFGVALIAGFGAEGALAGERRRGDGPWAALLLGGLVAARVAFAAARGPIESWAAGFGNDRMMDDFDYAFAIWGGNLTKLAAVVALGVVLLWLHRSGRIRAGLAGVLLSALVAVDLAVAHRDLNPVVEPDFYERPPLIAEHVPLDEIRRDYRYHASRFDSLAYTVPIIRGVPLEAQKWLWQGALAPNTGQLWKTLQDDHWDAIRLRRSSDARDFFRILPEAFRRWNLLRLHSVKYVYATLPVELDGSARELPLDSLRGHLYEVEAPLSRAYVAPEAVFLPDETAVINAVLHPSFVPRRQVALIDPAAPAWENPPLEATAPAREEPLLRAEIVVDRGEEVRVRVPEGSGGGFLVLTDAFYPGWEAEVDGRPRPIELANFFFRAVPLRAGDREVVFRYRSRPFEQGRRISLITLAAATLGLGLAILRRRAR